MKHTKCLAENCKKHKNFGKPGSNVAEYCKEHAPPVYEDVKNRKCLAENCKKQKKFGKSGYSAEYCAEHKTNDMISNPKKRKRDESNDIGICRYCCAEIHYNEQYCDSCKNYINLGRKTVKKHEKELMIKYLLENHFGVTGVRDQMTFRHDRIVDGGCSKRRPDFEIPTSWGTIILEVDEHQHIRNSYTCECEISRMKQIYFDCGVEHILFVRYNPDSYKPLDCDKPESRIKREEYLIKLLKKYISDDFENKKFDLGVLYLYYDGFSRSTAEIEKVDPYGS